MFDNAPATPSPFDTPTVTLPSGLQAFTYPTAAAADTPKTLYIGVDEVGRGALISRVYVAACILPDPAAAAAATATTTTPLDFNQLRDSKKIAHKHIAPLAETIKSGAQAYAIAWEDEATIDCINILQATQSAMHKAIAAVLAQLPAEQPVHLLVDGNYFNPFYRGGRAVPFTTVEGGDNAFCVIAAASILAKHARDSYIQDDLCVAHPELDIRYALKSNVGYGSARHLDGIRAWGISPWHRRTFGICKQYSGQHDSDLTPTLDIALRDTLAQRDAAEAIAKAPKPKKERAPKPPKEPKAPRAPRRKAVTPATLAALETTIIDFMAQIQGEIATLLNAHRAHDSDSDEDDE
jgi:ribonuclease HII